MNRGDAAAQSRPAQSTPANNTARHDDPYPNSLRKYLINGNANTRNTSSPRLAGRCPLPVSRGGVRCPVSNSGDADGRFVHPHPPAPPRNSSKPLVDSRKSGGLDCRAADSQVPPTSLCYRGVSRAAIVVRKRADESSRYGFMDARWGQGGLNGLADSARRCSTRHAR